MIKKAISIEDFKEFLDTQYEVGVLVELLYAKEIERVYISTNLKFRRYSNVTKEQFEEMIKNYPIKRKKNGKSTIIVELKEKELVQWVIRHTKN